MKSVLLEQAAFLQKAPAQNIHSKLKMHLELRNLTVSS